MVIFPTVSVVSQLQAIITALYDGLCDCRLYKNVVQLGGNTVVGDLVEADFGGYAAVSPATWPAASTAAVMQAHCKQDAAVFTCDGTAPANDVYGAYFVNGGVLLAVQQFPGGPVNIANLGDSVTIQLDLFLGPLGVS